VLVNSAVFIVFAYSFFKPRTFRDWRSFGAFSGFMVALFAEMYGFPLSIYFLSGWLQSRYPGIDWFSHDAGHLLEMLFGWKTNPHFGPFHILSFILIGYTTAERAVRAGARPRASWGLSPVVWQQFATNPIEGECCPAGWVGSPVGSPDCCCGLPVGSSVAPFHLLGRTLALP